MALVLWPNAGGAQAQAADAAATVGIALPLSGPHRILGAQMKEAAGTAFRSINAGTSSARGVPRNLQAIAVSFIDDACSVERGVAQARAATVAQPPLAAVIGHPCPSVAHAVAPIYAAAGMLFIAAGTLPGRTAGPPRAGPLHFRLPPEANPAAAIADVLAATPAEARIAMVRDRTQLSTGLMTQVQSNLAKRGRTIAAMETFAGGDKDFAALIERLRSAGITHIAFGGFPAEAGLFLDALAARLPAVRVVGADTLATAEFNPTAERHKDRLAIVMAPDHAAYPRATEAIRGGDDLKPAPPRQSLALYGALHVWASGAGTAKSFDAGPVAKILATEQFSTPLGTFGFDAGGIATLPAMIGYRWRDGAWRPEKAVD